MIIEWIIAGLVLVGTGTYIGKSQQPKPPPPAERPSKWQPAEHSEMVIECAFACGEGRFKSYNSVYGKCECIND